MKMKTTPEDFMHLNISKEFLKGAELALANELYRVAAANSYYAMFWAAQAALRHVGITREEWSHGGLQQAFGLELSPLIKGVRGLLRNGDWSYRAWATGSTMLINCGVMLTTRHAA
jgi:hypothetical protein